MLILGRSTSNHARGLFLGVSEVYGFLYLTWTRVTFLAYL